MGLSVTVFCSKCMHMHTYSCCSNNGQSGLLLHQLVPVQDWLGEIPSREYRTFSLHPPGVCIRCHRPCIRHHWIWAKWEKSVQIIYGAEKKVKKSGASGCAPLSCWTVLYFMCFSCLLCSWTGTPCWRLYCRSERTAKNLSEHFHSYFLMKLFHLLTDSKNGSKVIFLKIMIFFFSPPENSHSGNTELLYLAIGFT